jgi:hypothetical protein
MDIVNKILEWPVIFQGVLGSFLFWLLFTIGQRGFDFFVGRFKEEKELGSFFGRAARDSFYQHDYDTSNYNFFLCIYAALHYFLKFVFAAFLGSIVYDFIPVFGYVGYLLGLYFLFRSISYVTHFDTFDKEDNQNKKSKS